MSTYKFQCPSQCSGAQATLGQRFHLTDKSLYFLRQGDVNADVSRVPVFGKSDSLYGLAKHMD
jgi:hypothetical protein